MILFASWYQTFDGPPLTPADAAGQARMMQWNSAIVDYF